MGTHIGIVIDCYGPYKGIQAARESAKSDYEDGLHLFIGKQKYQKLPAKLLYVGLSGSLQYRLTPQHPILPDISGEPTIWLGEIVYYGIPGPASQNLLQLAEWATAFFASSFKLKENIQSTELSRYGGQSLVEKGLQNASQTTAPPRLARYY